MKRKYAQQSHRRSTKRNCPMLAGWGEANEDALDPMISGWLCRDFGT